MEHCFLSSLRVNAASEMFGLEFVKIVSFQISLGSRCIFRVGLHQKSCKEPVYALFI